MSDILIDGLSPTEGDLHYLALVNYGAYTSFRVEDGGVRGLDLHLKRLDGHAVDLFGEPVGQERLRRLVRSALGERRDAWVRISLFSPEIWARTPEPVVCPKVMTLVAPAPSPLGTSMRIQVRTYEREEAHIKHTAIFGLIRARRLARQADFDDALFVDADGKISEGTTWNIGLVRGDLVTWPQAPMLPGVTQALITQGLAEVGMRSETVPVSIDDLDRFDAAFLCNSATPACPITAIGQHPFAPSRDIIARVQAAWSAAVPQPV